jgi:hypothetical protein
LPKIIRAKNAYLKMLTTKWKREGKKEKNEKERKGERSKEKRKIMRPPEQEGKNRGQKIFSNGKSCPGGNSKKCTQLKTYLCRFGYNCVNLLHNETQMHVQ